MTAYFGQLLEGSIIRGKGGAPQERRTNDEWVETIYPNEGKWDSSFGPHPQRPSYTVPVDVGVRTV
jgi:hypothetical protein